MTSRRLFVTVAVAVGLAYATGVPPAHADPAPSAATAPKKRPATAAKPKPKPAPKKPPKQVSPEAVDSKDAAKPGTGAGAAHDIVEHESRIEFDERMVHGQSAAGAIFLFQRTPSDLKSIVEVPTTFRERTVEMLQPRQAAP